MSTHKVVRESIIYASILLFGAALLWSTDAYEWWHGYSRRYEHLEIDEIFLMIPLVLACGVVFSFHRFLEVKKTTRKLELANKELAEAYSRIAELDKAKQAFLAMACHELNTPVNGVTQALQLVQVKDDDSGQWLDLAKVGTSNLRVLINSVLEFSRIDQGKEPISPHPFSVRNSLENVEKIVRSLVRAKGLELRISVDPDVPAEVLGHEGWFRLVALNLLGNAVKFSLEGAISIHCGFQDDPAALRLAVADTGPGISAEQLETIFQPFEQYAPGQGGGRGVGLGLAIVKRLMERLNGSISVASEKGKGSVFTAIFPVDRPC